MDLKTIDNYRKNEIMCCKAFFALTALAYVRPESQKELGYPLLCNYQDKSGVYKKNLSKAYHQLSNISRGLLKLGKDLGKDSDPENIFTILCTMIDTAERLEFFSNDQDGWKCYRTFPKTIQYEAVQEMVSEWREKYYNALIQPAISAQKEAETLNKRISKINEEIAELEEELETIQSDKEGKTAIAEKKKKELQDLASSYAKREKELDATIVAAQKMISDLNKLTRYLNGFSTSNKRGWLVAADLHARLCAGKIYRQTVGVADGQNGDPAVHRGLIRPTIADEFAFGNIADQDDLRLQSQNGAQVKVQPRLVPRRACDAVERNARAHAVALKLGIIQQAIL